MAGFRVWDRVGIEGLLDHLTKAVLDEITDQYDAPSEAFQGRIRSAIKRVLNHDIYASPTCGDFAFCQEEGRAKPWSRQTYNWGLISKPDEDF
ncbi:MAG: hypothetical protein ACE5JP_00890 [Candidatus Bipolaricaulia bacterium]